MFHQPRGPTPAPHMYSDEHAIKHDEQDAADVAVCIGLGQLALLRAGRVRPAYDG